jgi:hypothetical protein
LNTFAKANDEINMMQLKDYVYKFQGLWEQAGECRIRIYKIKGDLTVFICSELPSNQGGSITTLAEGLAHDIWRAEGQPRPFVWIEHYPANVSPKNKETFDKVTFIQTPEGRFFTPKWDVMRKEEVEQLVAQSV